MHYLRPVSQQAKYRWVLWSTLFYLFQGCQAEEETLNSGGGEGDGYLLVVFVRGAVYDYAIAKYLVVNMVANL
jgi:hypothetical protein